MLSVITGCNSNRTYPPSTEGRPTAVRSLPSSIHGTQSPCSFYSQMLVISCAMRVETLLRSLRIHKGLELGVSTTHHEMLHINLNYFLSYSSVLEYDFNNTRCVESVKEKHDMCFSAQNDKENIWP
jgi:hypothetical protein